jgi:hypothetical protein
MDEIDHDGAQQPHQDVQDWEVMSPPIPLVIGIIVQFYWKMEPS